MPAIWRPGNKAVVTDPPPACCRKQLTEGTVTGTTQQDGYYDVHIENGYGDEATYRNTELRRP